ncbi:type IV secretory system conjugative DNA transfer family protein [Candidatus Peregrinibacteria bacterium]|nr:type IV secretory system conjugative DNA transfer family protein [Candidatus Peregrinibacteria bacterium]
MDIFGTGQGNGNHSSSRQTSPEEQEAQAKAVVGGLILLATAKYLPIALIGVTMGTIVNRGARGTYGWSRVRPLLFGISFFSLVLFLAVGLPLQKPTAPLLGLLYRFDSFKAAISDALYAWNKYFDLPILKALRFNVKHMTYHDVTGYFWIAIAAAGAVVLLHEVWAFFKPKDRTAREELGPGTRLCMCPARGTTAILRFVFLRWIPIGRTTAWSIGSDGVKAFLRGVAWVAILGVGAALIVAYVLPHLMPIAMIDYLGYLVFGPAMGVGYGFALGAVDYVTNGQPILPSLLKRKDDEFYLGDDFQGRAYGLSEKNLSYHVEVIAPTGSGKTNLLKNLIADRIHRGHGLIFLDLKAEFQVVSWMMRTAAAANRAKELRLVSLANRELSVPYNPVKLGSAPEIHSQLMNSMSWSEDYYRKISSMALMTLLRGLCEHRDQTGELFHLGHLYELLSEPGLLRAFCGKLSVLQCPAARDVELLCEKLDRSAERDKLTGLVANLGLLIHSAAGPLISEDVSSGSFDFREAVNEGRITYVLMNSMKLRETASVFGKMILQDLMRIAGDRYSEMDGGKIHKPATLIIDEFAAFAIPEFIEFMDRARGAGIGIVFAHQSRADLRAVSPEFQDRIEANSNTVIVSGVKSSEDAEYFAGILGTRTVKKETVQVEDGFLGTKRTGMKSIRETEEYIVHPNRLKDLQQGEVFTVSRTVDPRWAMVNVPQASEFETHDEFSHARLVEQLEKIRRHYMASSKDRYLDLTSTRGPELSRRKHDPAPEIDGPARNPSGPELWS